MLKFQDQEIRRPDIFFQGWSRRQFLEWLQIYGDDSTTADHVKSVKETMRELEQYEMYELCAMAKIYLDSISCASV